MRSFCLPEFWEQYEALPDRVRRVADRCYERWEADPTHPGLRFKPLEAKPGWWSVRIGSDYRAICLRDGDACVWFFIGSHAEYDRLTG